MNMRERKTYNPLKELGLSPNLPGPIVVLFSSSSPGLYIASEDTII